MKRVLLYICMALKYAEEVPQDWNFTVWYGEKKD
jgi:hypothetical protein